MTWWGRARQAIIWLYEANPWDLRFVTDGRTENFQEDIANSSPTSLEIKKKKDHLINLID